MYCAISKKIIKHSQVLSLTFISLKNFNIVLYQKFIIGLAKILINYYYNLIGKISIKISNIQSI